MNRRRAGQVRLEQSYAASVRRMYDDGLSTQQIAERSGLTQQVVRVYLRASYREPSDGTPWSEQNRSGSEKRRDTGEQAQG